MSEAWPGAWQSICVGIKTREGVILAGTKAVTYGYMRISQSGRSIFVIDNIGLGFSGHVADYQSVVRELELEYRYWKYTLGRRLTIRAIAHRLSLLLWAWKIFPMLTFAAVAGYDPLERDFKLYVLDPVGSILDENYAAAGLSEEMALGLLEDRYREDMTLEEAKKLAVDVLKVVSRRDVFATGRWIDLAIVTKDKAELTTVEIGF